MRLDLVLASSRKFSLGRFEATRSWLETRTGRRAARLLAAAITFGVLALLAIRLSEIGWLAVWRSLPTHPLFYALHGVIFLALPLSELLIFRLLWGTRVRSSLPAFVRKRVYNTAVLGYSGEVYLALWARRRVPLSERQLISTIKDNGILSAVASTTVAACLLLALLAIGRAEIFRLGTFGVGPAAVAIVALAFIVALCNHLRRRILALAGRTAAIVLGIHVVRLLGVLVLQAAQWHVALPDQPLGSWLLLLSAEMALTRIPLLPNTDLVFVGLGIGLTDALRAPAAGFAAMLVAVAALSQLTNFGCFIVTAFVRPPDSAAAGGSSAARSAPVRR